MSIWQIIWRLVAFVRPYKGLVIASLLLTLLGAVAAQVNPLVLRYTVDTVERLLNEGVAVRASTSLLIFISAILFVKELINIAVKYGQSMVGENLRVNLSSSLAQQAIERILTYKYAFYAADENATGKLQTRIDRGVESLTSFVQNIFIELLPLFANAALALVLMFSANFYVGLIASAIMPIYFLLSWRQAFMLRGVRRGLRDPLPAGGARTGRRAEPAWEGGSRRERGGVYVRRSRADGERHGRPGDDPDPARRPRLPDPDRLPWRALARVRV